jgi:hypothetical protein
MKNEFTPYDRSLKLKAIGFDEPCFVFWTNTPKYKGDNIQLCITDGMHGYSPNSISFKQDFLREGEVLAPLYQQAFRWFREKYGLFVYPNVISYEDGPYLWFFEINSTVLPFGTDLGETDDYKTYEEAELACLDKLIEIIETKNK